MSEAGASVIAELRWRGHTTERKNKATPPPPVLKWACGLRGTRSAFGKTGLQDVSDARSPPRKQTSWETDIR